MKDTGKLRGVQTAGISNGRILRGRLTYGTIKVALDGENKIAVLRHELSHLALLDLCPSLHIPSALNEGLAALNETQANINKHLKNFNESKEMFRLDQLLTMDYPKPEHYPLFYGQSVSFVQFLVDKGMPRVLKLVRYLAAGENVRISVKLIYGVSLEQMEEEWLSKL